MRGTDFSKQDTSEPGARGEDARLDRAIERADDLLVTSLKADEHRRTVRRRIFITLGGLAMITIVTCVVISLSMQGELALNAAGDAQKSGQLSQEGWKLWQERKFDEAAEKFEEAVKLAPRNTAAWNGLGWSRFNSGQSEAADKAFKKVIAIEPKHPAALNGLGQSAFLRGDYKAAERYLLKAAPQASAAWWGLAKIYLLQGDFDKAQKWAKKIVDSGEADQSAQQMLKAAEDKQLDPDLRQLIEPPAAAKAAGDGDKPAAKTSDKKSQTAANPSGRGWQLYFQGRTAEAKELFEQALADDPDDGAALNGLGWCLLNAGEVDEAKPYFEKVVAANPDAAGALNGLARVLEAQDDVDGAIKIWEDMIERFPSATAVPYELANAYMTKSEYEKAVPLLEKLAKEQPDNEQIKSKLERAREQAK